MIGYERKAHGASVSILRAATRGGRAGVREQMDRHDDADGAVSGLLHVVCVGFGNGPDAVSTLMQGTDLFHLFRCDVVTGSSSLTRLFCHSMLLSTHAVLAHRDQSFVRGFNTRQVSRYMLV